MRQASVLLLLTVGRTNSRSIPCKLRVLIPLIAALGLYTSPTRAQTPPAAIRMCQATDLSLVTDDENGSFNGMSHSGTLLVLRNVAPDACRLNPIPQLSLIDATNKDLGVKVTLDTPFSRGPSNGRTLPMGHGPVVLPIVLAAGAEATACLRWISGPVFAHSVCLTSASLQVTIAASPVTTELKRTVCGENRTRVIVTTTRLALDPSTSPDTYPRVDLAPSPAPISTSTRRPSPLPPLSISAPMAAVPLQICPQSHHLRR